MTSHSRGKVLQFLRGRSWSRRLSIKVGEKERRKERRKERKRGSGWEGAPSRGVVPVSQDAFLRVRGFDACGLLIATRLDALSRVHTSWGYVLDGWMDGQARYKDRITYPTGCRVLRWSQMMRNRFTVCTTRARVCISRSLFGIKISLSTHPRIPPRFPFLFEFDILVSRASNGVHAFPAISRVLNDRRIFEISN